MVDLFIGAVLVGLAIRGWLRGFVREALGLVAIVVGLVLAFRLSTPLSSVVSAMAGTSANVSRLVAGIVIVVLLSTAVTVVSYVMHRTIRVVPGLTFFNRAVGAALGLAAGVLIVAATLALVAVLPMPPAVAEAVTDSEVADALGVDDGVGGSLLDLVSGDAVLGTLSRIQGAVDDHRLVDSGTGAVVSMPAADEAELRISAADAAGALDLLNRERAAMGLEPLVASSVLDELAVARAMEVYRSGRFARDPGDGGTLQDRLAAASVLPRAADQVMALAVSVKAAHEGIVEVDGATIGDREFRRVGIGIVHGPLGVLVVEVLTR